MRLSYPAKVEKAFDEAPHTKDEFGETWTGPQLFAVKIPKPVNGDHWGNWYYNTSNPPSLDYKPYKYEVIIDELNTPQGFTHWVVHLLGKSWGRDSIGDFVQAVYDLDLIGKW